VAEPEDVIAEGALIATRVVRDLWARRDAGAAARSPQLQDVRRRVELFVAAVFSDAPEIGVADPPAPLNLLARLARRQTAHLHVRTAISSTDGYRIRLPGVLESLPASAVVDRYRLLALEQASRASRGTPAATPGTGPLLRDLYLLAEAAAVDTFLVLMLPRLRPSLVEARIEARNQRTLIPKPSRQELAMDALIDALLMADPATPPAPFVVAETPAASRRWAETMGVQLSQVSGPYRGMAPIALWGAATAPPESAATTDVVDGERPTRSARSHALRRRPKVRDAGEDEDDAESGTWMVRADDPKEKVEDPAGLQRPADRDQDADPGELADALSELPEARLVRSPEAVRELLVGDDPIRRVPESERARHSTGIVYPEWDWRIGAYRRRGAIVRERAAEVGDESWVDATLRRHAAMLRDVRRDFERLRPRRTALRRQPDGSDIDVDAVVAAFADGRGGGVSDDRLYIDARPLRRDVAIALLVDASASTDSWVSGDRRIIDVEKEALLVVEEALVALGDPHAILSFSGEGPTRVEIRIVRQFDGHGAAVDIRRRIAGLEPAGYTRAGAAIRHATAGLIRQGARHRLLLLLSDGRPNDVDQYEGRYGVEDTRVAVAEARLQGVHCFCLTVDREAPRYAARIFGRDFAVLSRAERLPTVLTSLLRDLMRG
jgi:nitric oxide reductase NorD protein